MQNNDPINAFISIFALSMLILAIFMTKFECLSVQLITLDNKQHSSLILYLQVLRNAFVVLMLWVGSYSRSIILKIGFWWAQSSLTIWTIILLRMTVIKQLIVLTFFEFSIWVWIPFYQFQYSTYQNNSQLFKDNTDSVFWMLILSIFSIWMIIILWPDINFFKACWKKKLLVPNK